MNKIFEFAMNNFSLDPMPPRAAGEADMLFNNKRDEDFTRDVTIKSRHAVSPLPPDHLQPPKPRKAQTRSVIDPGLVITGLLEGDGELQVDGQVRGDIRCTHLTVGNKATISGNIAADEVVVRGKVKGVIGANRVVLADGAHVESQIFHKRLAIEEGARFDGEARCREHPIDEMQAVAAEIRAAETAKSEPGETESDTGLAGA
jgi:cytoskeletal protein CcmA (bactofilin family)